MNKPQTCRTYVPVQDFQLNRVALEEGAGAEASPAGARPKKKNRKTYDLTAADKFWQKHKGRSVPCVCVFLNLRSRRECNRRLKVVTY